MTKHPIILNFVLLILIELWDFFFLLANSCVAWATVAFVYSLNFMLSIHVSRNGRIEEGLLTSLLIEFIMPLFNVDLLIGCRHHLTSYALWICNQRCIDVILVLVN